MGTVIVESKGSGRWGPRLASDSTPAPLLQARSLLSLPNTDNRASSQELGSPRGGYVMPSVRSGERRVPSGRWPEWHTAVTWPELSWGTWDVANTEPESSSQLSSCFLRGPKTSHRIA